MKDFLFLLRDGNVYSAQVNVVLWAMRFWFLVVGVRGLTSGKSSLKIRPKSLSVAL